MDSLAKSSNKVYFKNLNAIRCIAAFLVIIHHIEQFKDIFHLPNYWKNPVIESIGRLGVILFFVLSGFLISYLLFKEKEVTQTISIKDFYLRRILRIWPLYFLIILTSLFVIPFVPFFTLEGFETAVVWHHLFYKILLFVFFMPNLMGPVFGVIPYASQTWSIGAEEQFYLVWPWLNKKINNKWVLLFGVIIFYYLVKFSIPFFPHQIKGVLKDFWLSTPIDCMAIGGLFAFIIFDTTAFVISIKKVLFSKITQIIALIMTVAFILTNYHFPLLDKHFHFELYAILFGILISNFAANENRIFSMENKISSYLGKISYGVYMYHPIVIVLCIKIGMKYTNTINDFVLYPIVFLLVVLLSSLSYEFYEKRFIAKKTKYSKIISGDNAKE